MNFISELGTKAKVAGKRFPFVSHWVFFGSLFLIVQLEIDENRFFESSWNTLYTPSLGVSWLIAVQFFLEQYPRSRWKWVLNLLVLALLGLYYFSLPESYPAAGPEVFLRWFLLFLAGHVFLFFAPFVRNWHATAFWNYLKNIILAIGRSILFSGIFYLGLVFALLAIDALFDIEFNGRVYWQLFIFCLGIINTAMYLSDFPKQVQENTRVVYNRPLEVLVKFILIPLLAVYLIILYLYSFKIVLAWELPEGWISYMISVLALLGFIIQIIIDPVRENHPSLLFRKFHPWFYLLLAPLMLLLFTAVFRRILDYNFTESRYFLLLLSFWILGILIYLLARKQRQLRVLPISLFLLILLGSFGPWGAFEVSARAQLGELKELLAEAKDKAITAEQDRRILNISRYLANRNQLGGTEEVLGFNPEIAFKDQSTYNIGRKILDSLNVKTDLSSSIEGKSYSFFRRTEHPVDLDLRGFSRFTEISFIRYGEQPLSFTEDSGIFRIEQEEQLLLEFDIEKELLTAVNNYDNLYAAPPETFEYDFQNERGVFRIIFKELSFAIEDGKPKVHSAVAYLFYSVY